MYHAIPPKHINKNEPPHMNKHLNMANTTMKHYVFINSMSINLAHESNSCETESLMNDGIMYTWGGVTGQVVWFRLLCQSRLLCIQNTTHTYVPVV